MFAFLRSHKVDAVLNEPKRLSTADYLCRLMEEQNSLLRELLRAQGRHPATIRATPTSVNRIRTDKDVLRITREMVLEQEAKEREKKEAMWRNGPASDLTGSTSGNTPSAPESGPAASPQKPSAL